ncbi:hypothetical protein SPSIL_036020 [Sporomusa silvacetica DSM 10669]|uniref:Uncharacterized protein n=1 Tax=Sporomusa silvacetica DSM 10669 TaxID=1123289 RepID=A0ABZ3INX1_9FIRM|nr:hypothetical protein [Sporomusa silvacetica]OZC14066.1 hypothetical protein SPSIL_51090 [Sporomusa silvacetica DSM 10669]
MVMVYTPGKKYECVEIKPVQFKLLIDGAGQEYLLMHDLGRQHLFAVQHREGEQLDFTYIDNVTSVEEEQECWKRWTAGFVSQ